MMNTLNRFGPLTGRLLIALLFLISGFGKITGFGDTVGSMAAKGIPMPELATMGAIVIELTAGAMILLGWKSRFGAIALFVYTLIAALMFHGFWGLPPDQTHQQMIHFMKNLSIMGGLLFVIVYGSGPLSIERTETYQNFVEPAERSYGMPSKGAPARNNSLDFRESI